MEVQGKNVTFFGTVLLILADTLAAHQLGGFKFGVEFAYRKCRDCLSNQNDIETKVTHKMMLL